MKGLTLAQWINLYRNNGSVLVCRCSVLGEKTDPIPPPLVSLTAGRLSDEMQVGFKILKILLIYSDFYFVYYHCNFTTVLKLHFSQLLSSRSYFKIVFKREKFGSHFFNFNLYN